MRLHFSSFHFSFMVFRTYENSISSDSKASAVCEAKPCCDCQALCQAGPCCDFTTACPPEQIFGPAPDSFFRAGRREITARPGLAQGLAIAARLGLAHG